MEADRIPGNDVRVLVVEDDSPMQRLIRRTLELAGYRVTIAGDGYEGLAAFEREPSALIILDVVLPGLDGIELCGRIRAVSQTPIIIIGALGQEQDKVRGLDAGADDYVTKPFAAGEMIARVKAVLRRSAWSTNIAPSAGVLRVAALEIDLDQHMIRRGEDDIVVTPLEFRLLAYLAAHAGRVLTHAMVLQAVWGAEYTDELHMLRVNVSRTRQKIERDPSTPQIILTVPGVGYTVPSG